MNSISPWDASKTKSKPHQVALIHEQRVSTLRNCSKGKKDVRAPETPPLPLSGVSEQVFSSLTMSTPSTTVGVRVIVHF